MTKQALHQNIGATSSYNNALQHLKITTPIQIKILCKMPHAQFPRPLQITPFLHLTGFVYQCWS
jgi:hypothetical protein